MLGNIFDGDGPSITGTDSTIELFGIELPLVSLALVAAIGFVVTWRND